MRATKQKKVHWNPITGSQDNVYNNINFLQFMKLIENEKNILNILKGKILLKELHKLNKMYFWI